MSPSDLSSRTFSLLPTPSHAIGTNAAVGRTNRILVPVEVLKAARIAAGDCIVLRPAGDAGGEKANEETALDIVAGVAWPSFAADPESILIPNILLHSSTLSYGDLVRIEPKPVFHGVSDEIVVAVSPARPGSSQGKRKPKEIETEERELLGIYVKEVLLDLCYVREGQCLQLKFRGATLQLRLSAVSASSSKSSTSDPVPSQQPCFFSVVRSTRISLAKSPNHDISSSSLSDATTNSQQGATTEEKSRRAVEAYGQVGGLDKQIEDLRSLVEMPLMQPGIFTHLGLKPPKGVLLYGPPGTGKTLLARAVAASTGSSVLVINGPELSSAYHGETESKLRQAFAEAKRRSPCVIVMDEIDALAPKRDGGDGGAGEVERRVVATLLTCMDGMESQETEDDEDAEGSDTGRTPPRVVIVAATNRPNAIDPALRRPGRLDREVEIGIPDVSARLSILKVLLAKMPHTLSEDDLAAVANKTHGYVGADLSALVREAGMLAIRRSLEQGPGGLEASLAALSLDGEPSSIPDGAVGVKAMRLQPDDLLNALSTVRPSAMREVFIESPRVYWKDIGGQREVHQRIKESIEWPLRHPEAFARLGITPPRGVLLYGPPGCSKTLTAKALATESGLNFIAIKGPELFNKYVGESERAVREVFRKARAAAPSIVFFDEIDALTIARGGANGESGGSSGDRVIASLLNEMDGIEALNNVIIVAATNRPDVIDPALLRPGRLDRLLYVGPPDLAARTEILRIRMSKMSVADDVDVDALAQMTEGCSGAEVVGICQDAGLLAMNEDLDAPNVRQEHFVQAARAIRRRITPEMLRSYERWRDQTSV